MKIIVRPFENSDAGAFAEAVNTSLDTLKPWMVWAHENYTAEDARRWFSYTHLQRRQGVANEQGVFAEDGRLLGAQVCATAPGRIFPPRWATGFAAANSVKALPVRPYT